MWTRTGNYFYCAPEIFQGIKYNEKVDIWAIGVMLYQFLFGRLPFCQDTIIDTIDMITSEEIDFDELPNVSALAIDFLRRVL
jgi:serine/threonine protein kinase